MDKKKILACDDDIDILDVMNIVLSENSYEIQTCDTEDQIYNRVLEFKPDVILLDVWMTSKDIGYLVEKLKTIDDGNFEIVLVSALNDLDKISKKYNINKFLSKPFTISDLLNIVDLAINEKRPIENQ